MQWFMIAVIILLTSASASAAPRHLQMRMIESKSSLRLQQWRRLFGAETAAGWRALRMKSGAGAQP